VNVDRQTGRQVDDLLAPLRDRPADAADLRPDSGELRERVVAGMMRAGSVASEPRGWMPGRIGIFAVAATCALILGVVRWAGNPQVSSDRELAVLSLVGDVTWRGVKAMPLAAGQSATIDAAGDVVTAASGEARLRAATGVEIDVATDTHVGLDELRGRRASVRLYAGKVHCRVPRLAASDTFSVVTRDVHVVVHGTAFSVETSRQGMTSVRVDEGVVVVHHPGGDVTLAASQAWTNEPAAEPPRAATTSTVAPAPPRRLRVSPPPRGTLNKETRLLRSGLAAERSGDLTRARASFDQLLTRFPHSPLAPDAREALARVQLHQRAQQRAAP
jgi:hypothetical protein